MVYSFE